MNIKLSLMVIFLIILVIPSGIALAHEGEPTPTTLYEGPMLLVPYINDSPRVDGNFSLDKYPELGHRENISGFLDEISFSNNRTYLFIRLTFLGEGVAGVGLLTKGFENNDKYLYFLGIDNGTSLETKIIQSNDEYTSPFTQINETRSFIFSHSFENNITTVEFALPISAETINGLRIPSGGNTFYILTLHGDENDLSATDVLKSPLFSAYMMRNGENPAEISRIMANNPNWVDIFGYPVILLALGLFTVYYYYKKNSIP